MQFKGIIAVISGIIKMRKLVYISFLICFVNMASAQINSIEFGTWRMHVPYYQAQGVTEIDNGVMVNSSYGFFIRDFEDHTMTRLSKIEGFAGTIVSKLRHYREKKTTVIVFDDLNIDLLKNGKDIINFDDVVRKNLPGVKKCYHIMFHQNLVYLSTSLGILVIDIDKEEIKGSYLNIGSFGTRIPVYSTAIYKNNLYASTDKGVIKTSNDANAIQEDFRNWSLSKAGVSKGGMALFKNSLYTEIDSLVWQYDGTVWTKTLGKIKRGVTNIQTEHGKMFIGDQDTIFHFKSLTDIKKTKVSIINHVIYDYGDQPWFANNFNGLTTLFNGNPGYVYPNGPSNISNYEMLNIDDEIWVLAGGTSGNFGPTYNSNGYYYLKYSNNQWISKGNQPMEDKLVDVICATEGLNGEIYMGTYHNGIVVLKNHKPILNYDHTNTNGSLKQFANVQTKVAGIKFDKNGTLWASNYDAQNALVYRLQSGQWGNITAPSVKLGQIDIDSNNVKWIAQPYGSGLLVYDDNNTPQNTNDDKFRTLRTGVGNGDLPSNTINSIAVDMDNEVWIGTSFGLAIFQDPYSVFVQGVDANRIVVKQGKVNGYLLGNEVINDIEIDGANRKWIATNNGAWLVNDNGREIDLHFTQENSPLPSNKIKTIAVNDKTGEVFFGTNKGIMSYKWNATRSAKKMDKLKIYPNPVKNTFRGDIAIEGTKDNALVRITDINGNIVYETHALGGTAIWNGKNLDGKRPKTGVYLVFIIEEKDENGEDGKATTVGKIVFIN